jgi:16S rRNA (cytosine967-C5)-methyltransferase
VIASNPSPRKGAREIATEILAKVDTRKAYADLLLDHALKSAELTARDRALLTEMTYGTLRWRGRLDGALKPHFRRPLEKTDPFLRNLLRLSLYQLMFLNRVPDYAALNDAVQLAKRRGGGRAGGFINAVLRNYLRQKKDLSEPDPLRSSSSAIAEYWSHPEWLVQKWLLYFGRNDTVELLKANNEEAPLILRINLARTTRDQLLQNLTVKGIEAAPTPWSPQGVIVRSRLPVEKLVGFHEGLFQVQGEASQLVVYLLSPQPGERILDACAAPGGKSTHIAETMEDRGEVIATDISEKGLRLVKQNSDRLKLTSIRCIRADCSKPLNETLQRPFDRILVDAPCSGFGTLRSHPEIKWNRGAPDIERLSRVQQTILDRIAASVRAGGVLVYSTCTLIEEENEKIVERFLRSHAEFVLDDAAGYLPSSAKPMVQGRYFLSLPQRHHTDGFFAARMRKAS